MQRLASKLSKTKCLAKFKPIILLKCFHSIRFNACLFSSSKKYPGILQPIIPLWLKITEWVNCFKTNMTRKIQSNNYAKACIRIIKDKSVW